MLVYPRGDYETFWPSTHSDPIEFGGRKGFIKLALDQRVPIVPVVSIGGQETAQFVTRGETDARVTGLSKLARIKVLCGYRSARRSTSTCSNCQVGCRCPQYHDPGDAAGRPSSSASGRNRT